MTNSLRRLPSSLFVATIAALTAGCLTEGATTAPADCRTPPADLWLDATEVAGPSGPLTQLLIDGDEPVTLDGGACGCATDACRAAFVLEHLGDGVCVTFNCDGHKVGACSGGDHRPEHAELGAPAAAPMPAATADELDAASELDSSGFGVECSDDRTCADGLTCMAGGVAPHKQQFTCELACTRGGRECPSGTVCVTIHDGPGQVCRDALW